MFVVISYDVVDDHRRRRLAKYLLDYGTRVQKSVFECYLTPRQYLKVRQGAQEHIEPEEDSLRFYRLCENCVAKVETFGIMDLTLSEDLVIV